MNEKSELKNILFISYLFPPVAGGGVQRSSKFVKYLSQFGWNPIVLTVKEPYDFYRDDEMMKDVEGKCVIIRTFSIEPMKWVRKHLKRKSQKKLYNTDSSTAVQESLKPGILVRIKTYLFVPDNEILWLPFAFIKGMRAIRKYKPRLIYSTASPFTDHLIALCLAIISGLPWVADFRDLWVDRPNFPRNKWRLFIDRVLEKMVVNSADHILSATSAMTEHFSKLYPRNKYSTITNGYDEDDFSFTPVPEPVQEFRITYTGIFNKEQNPQKFFKAIHTALLRRADLQRNFKLRIIGQLDNPGDFENLNYFNQLGLNKYSDLIPYIAHKKAVKEMCQSTILLLLIGEYPNNEAILTGKIFEYIRSGRPILAVVPPNGLAAKVVESTNSGLIVNNSSVDAIADGILKLFDMYINKSLDHSFRRVGIEKYSRKNLTGELSEVFLKITEKQKSSDRN